MHPLTSNQDESSGEEDIKPPGRANRLKTHTPARHESRSTREPTDTLQSGELASAGPSPSRRGAKPRVLARRSRGGNLSLRTESRSLHTQPRASTPPDNEETQSSPASRPSRPSGPLTPGRFGQRRASHRSSTSSTSDGDVPLPSTKKAHSFMPDHPHSIQFPAFRGCARLNVSMLN